MPNSSLESGLIWACFLLAITTMNYALNREWQIETSREAGDFIRPGVTGISGLDAFKLLYDEYFSATDQSENLSITFNVVEAMPYLVTMWEICGLLAVSQLAQVSC
jgi:hypothetical protein